MSYTRKIAHNTIIQIFGKGISTAIGIVVIGMLTRYLGASGFGQYTTIMAFLQFFGVLVDMGLYIVLVKKISEPEADQSRWVSNIFTLRLISAVVFLGLAPVIVLFFPYAAIVKWGVLITSVSFLCITLNQALSGVFQKNLRMDKVMIAEVIGRVILLVSTIAVIRADLGLLWVMGAVVAGSMVNFLFMYFSSRRFARLRLRFEWSQWKEIIKESWPIALSIAFNLVYFKADTIILSLFHSQAAVGIYGASYKVLEVLNTLPAMFAGLVLPLLAAAWSMADKEKFKRVLQKAFDAMVILAVPLAIGTLFIARPVMDMVAPGFTDSAEVLRLLIFAAATIFVGNLFGNTVVAINRQKTMMWLYLLVAIVSLIGYLLLVPRYSYFGAASMTIVSELLVTISAIYIVGRYAKVWPSLKVLAKATVASGIMAVALFALAGFNVFLLLFVGVILYGVTLYAVGGVTRGTIKEIIRLR